MNDKIRILLSLFLIIGAFGWSIRDKKPLDSKLKKPSEEMIKLLSTLYEIEDRDSSEYAGMYYAMWQEYDKVEINSNLQLQYYLQFLGESVLQGENSGKYPEWSSSAAEIISKVIGKQNESELLTQEEQKNLKDLFYAFSWKMYNSEYDSVFEEYKDKAVNSIQIWINPEKPDNPIPSPNEECICKGLGYIVHGDGHKTDCPCVESGENCEHNPKCGYSSPSGLSNQSQKKAVKIKRGILSRIFGN